jgi:hypothetical protein
MMLEDMIAEAQFVKDNFAKIIEKHGHKLVKNMENNNNLLKDIKKRRLMDDDNERTN